MRRRSRRGVPVRKPASRAPAFACPGRACKRASPGANTGQTAFKRRCRPSPQASANPAAAPTNALNYRCIRAQSPAWSCVARQREVNDHTPEVSRTVLQWPRWHDEPVTPRPFVRLTDTLKESFPRAAWSRRGAARVSTTRCKVSPNTLPCVGRTVSVCRTDVSRSRRDAARARRCQARASR